MFGQYCYYLGRNLFFGGGLFMMIFWILIPVLIGVILYRVIKVNLKNEKEESLGILKKRYASGEISKEEFEKIKKEIS